MEITKWLNHYSELFTLLTLALAMRLIFYVGIGLNESLLVTEGAWDILVWAKSAITFLVHSPSIETIAAQFASLVDIHTLPEILKYAPISFLYWLGGVNELTSSLFSVTGSLASLCLLFSISQSLFSKNIAVFASFLWAVMPYEIFVSTALFPLELLLLIVLLSVWCFLRYQNSGLKPYLLLGTASLIALFVFDSMVTYALVGMLSFGYLSSREINRFWWIVPSSVLLVTGFVNPQAFSLLYSALGRLPEAGLLIPLALLSLSSTVLHIDKPVIQLYIFLSFVCLGLLIRFTYFPNPTLLFEPFLLLILAPVVILWARFLDRLLSPLSWRWLSVMSIVVVAIAWLAVRGQMILIPSFVGVDWISAPALMYLFRVMGSVVVMALLLAAGVLVNKKPRMYEQVGTLFLALMSLALVPASWNYVGGYQAKFEAERKAYTHLKTSSSSFPVYAYNDRQLYDYFRFLSGYESDGFGEKVKDVFGDQEFDRLGSANVVYWEDDLIPAPKTWLPIEIFGQLGEPRIVVARTLVSRELVDELNYLKGQAGSIGNAAFYYRLYGAELNAGHPCPAYQAWVQAQTLGQHSWSYILVEIAEAEDCFLIYEEPNLFEGISFSLRGRYTQFEHSIDPETTDEIWSARQKYSFYDDPRSLDVTYALDPDSIYLYSVTVKASDPTMVLYWSSQDIEQYAGAGVYPEFTTVAVLLATPNGDSPFEMDFSPALFSHFGNVFFKDFELTKVFGIE